MQKPSWLHIVTVSVIANLLCFRAQMQSTPYSLEFWLWSLAVAWTASPFWSPVSNRIIVWLGSVGARHRHAESDRFSLQPQTSPPDTP